MRIRGFSSSYEYEETNFRSHIREKASMSTIQLVQQPSPNPLPNKRKSKGCAERNSEIGSMPISINYTHTYKIKIWVTSETWRTQRSEGHQNTNWQHGIEIAKTSCQDGYMQADSTSFNDIRTCIFFDVVCCSCFCSPSWTPCIFFLFFFSSWLILLLLRMKKNKDMYLLIRKKV